MDRRKKRVAAICRLSADFPPAALPVTATRLAGMRQLLAECRHVADNLAAIAARLKQVAAPAGEPFIFTPSLADNEKLLRELFRDCEDIRYRRFVASGQAALLVYLLGMTDTTALEKDVLETLMSPTGQQQGAVTLDLMLGKLLTSVHAEVCSSPDAAVTAVMSGYGLLLIEGSAEVVSVGTIKHVKRSIEDAKTEAVARGPHDAFTETLADNISLIRRRARDPDIKVRIFQLGQRSKTAVALVYAASLVKPGLVAEMERRLAKIKVDQVTLAAQVEELIIDHPWSPFPQTNITERPDTLLVSVYEGRAGLIVDNTPQAIILPCTLAALMQSTEDFTIQPVVASLVRFSRYISFSLGIFLPAVYIGIVSYNPGMMPTTLAINVAELRARTPYPAFMEVIIMEVILELFQEAVVRLPQKIAPAANILGGFVIGTTIVQAGIVNALLVVATAGTAIASYTMPSYNLSLTLRWLRLPAIFAAAVLGMYGVVIAYLALIVHMCSLRSFGESFLGGLFDITLFEDTKDKMVRLPASWMGSRPKVFGPQDRTRIGE